jgi:hypothetical protein
VDFDLTREQQELRDAALDFVRRECPTELIRHHAALGTYEPGLW